MKHSNLLLKKKSRSPNDVTLFYINTHISNLCSVCFGVKWFLENDFGILRCLVGAKIMVNENHFRFDHKSFFNFWKTIYGFKNRKSFFKIILFIVAHTFDIRLPESGNSWSSESRRHWNSATSGYQNNVGAEIRRHLSTIARCRRTRFWQNLAGIRPWLEAGRIWPNPATNPARFRRQLHFHFS